MNWLFSGQDFFPRAACGDGWTRALVSLNQAANLLTFAAYFYIPVVLYRLYAKRRNDFPKSWLLPAFGAFIVTCGVGHVFAVVVFWWPAYRWFTVWDWMTAAAAWAVAVGLRYVADDLMKYPNVEQYRALLAERDAAVAEKTRLYQDMLALYENADRRNRKLETDLAAIRERAVELEQQDDTRVHDIAVEIRARLHEIRGNL